MCIVVAGGSADAFLYFMFRLVQSIAVDKGGPLMLLYHVKCELNQSGPLNCFFLETDLFYNLEMLLLYHVLPDMMDENQYMNIGL